jgi:transcriptional regulator with XRE-family HTH domain
MQKAERDVAARIASEVRRMRKDRGWSQGALAERTGLSVNYVSLIECADRLPTVEVLIRIASAFGAAVRDLLSDADPAEDADPWLSETTAILRALPADARPMVLGILRGASEAAVVPRRSGSGVRPRKRKPR